LIWDRDFVRRFNSKVQQNHPENRLQPVPTLADTSVLLFSSRRAFDARLECGRPELATHFEPRLAAFRANVHGRLNGALGVKTRRERRWRSAR
jgi:hypothetical protein